MGGMGMGGMGMRMKYDREVSLASPSCEAARAVISPMWCWSRGSRGDYSVSDWISCCCCVGNDLRYG
jgi:hypothetical protein